jgi:alpha-tubulin suppressor-like RCC1 family protein
MNTYGETGNRSGRTTRGIRLAAVAVAASLVAVGGPAGRAVAATPAAGWAWGDNGYGQLCDGSTTVRPSPVMMSGPDHVTQVAPGYGFTLLLRSDGTVWRCGLDVGGQLGTGGTSVDSTVPVQVAGLTDVVQVAAGGGFALALRADGTVAAWGGNFVGTLGDGTRTDSSTPVTVQGLTDVIQIGAGLAHGLALRSDGTVMAWGANNTGQLGIDDPNAEWDTPQPVDGLTGIRQISTRGLHNLVLRMDGTVMAWGNNFAGQVGPEGTGSTQYTPVTVDGLNGVTQIAAGLHHSLALLPDGTVAAWGLNGAGALGDGTTTSRSTPKVIEGLSGVKQICGSNLDSFALLRDGTVAAWGGDQYGQLGDGTTTTRLTPGPVPGLSDVTQVACGTYQIVAVTGGRGPAVVPVIHPVILGIARAGFTVTAVPGVFRPSATTYRYQWLRDGSPIADATAARYPVTAADRGHRLSVRVVATRIAYANGLAVSPAVQVRG